MKKFTFLKTMLLTVVLLVAGNGVIKAQGTETFTHGSSSSSYGAIAWTGTNGLAWSATDSRGDQVFTTGDKAICVRTGAITGALTTAQQAAGIGTLKFDYKIPFSDAAKSITVTITAGSTVVTKVLGLLTVGTPYNTGDIIIGSSNPTSLVLAVSSTATGARLIIDNLVWTSAAPPSASPVFTPAAGTYSTAQSVTISNGNATDKIYYTTDGTAPTSASTLYTGAINVAETTTIKAIAYDSNNANPSAVVTALYTINVPTITVTETSIPEMTTEVGSTDSKTITVSGIDLTANVDLAITGTDAGMFSVSPNTLAPVSGVVANTIVTVTYAPTVAGNHSATLEVSSPGAQTKSMPLTGVANVFTGIFSSHLDANAWAANGNVMFNAAAGERVEIFNSLGQKVVSSVAVEGLNKVSVAQTGMLIVKVNNRMSKVIL